MSYSLYPCVTAVNRNSLVFGGMAKVHELLQQLSHRGIESRTLSLPLYYNYALDHMDGETFHHFRHLSH